MTRARPQNLSYAASWRVTNGVRLRAAQFAHPIQHGTTYGSLAFLRFCSPGSQSSSQNSLVTEEHVLRVALRVVTGLTFPLGPPLTQDVLNMVITLGREVDTG